MKGKLPNSLWVTSKKRTPAGVRLRFRLGGLCPVAHLGVFEGAASGAADGLLLLDAAQLSLGDEPTLAAHGAQHPAAGDRLAKARKQPRLRFVRS